MGTRSTDRAHANAAHDSLIEILWRRRATVASSIAVALAAGTAYLAFAPKSYTAESRLFVERNGPQLLQNESGQQPTDNTTFLYTQKEVIESAPVLALVLKDPRIKEVPTIAQTGSKLSALRDAIGVEVGRKDELITVSASLPSPKAAAELAAMVVDAYVEFQSEGRSSRVRGILSALETEKAKTQAELELKTKQLSEYQKTAGVLPAYEQWAQGAVGKLNNISDEVAQCRLDIANLGATFDAVSTPLLQNPDSAQKLAAARERLRDANPSAEDEALARTQLMDLKTRLANLHTRYLPNHPNVQGTAIAVDQATATYAALVERRLAAAKLREATLSKLITDEQARLIAAGTKADEYHRLENEVSRVQKLSDTLENRIREFSITGDAQTPSISVLEASHVDERATSPRASRTLGLAGLLGLALGSLAAFARDRSRLTLRFAGDAAAATQLPTLATYSPGAMSDVGAKLRPLCETILRHQQSPELGIAVAITSGDPGDGRSSVAKAIATAMALSGRRTLLLNADPTSSGVEDSIYGAGPGLTDAVVSADPLAATTHLTKIENLDVLGLGNAAADASLDSEAFESILVGLRKSYEAIIIDTAPVSEHVAGRIVPSVSDVTIHVLRSGELARGRVRSTLDSLACVGVRPIGTVLFIGTGKGRRKMAQGTEAVIQAEDGSVQWPTKMDVFGVGVSPTSYEDAERLIIAAARRRQSAVVTHLAVHPLVTAVTDPSFRKCIQSFDLVAPDGQPVRWALNVFHRARLPDRCYGPELMLRLCRAAARWNIGVYLYGSSPSTLDLLKANLQAQIPDLNIVGMESPPFRPLSVEESEQAAQRINDSGAGLAFIGLGCPKQDYFAHLHRDRINAVQLCVGAAFDFHAGTKPMAPGWMQRSGLEWAFRLTTEPGRLWKRYLVTNSIFVFLFARRMLAGR